MKKGDVGLLNSSLKCTETNDELQPPAIRSKRFLSAPDAISLHHPEPSSIFYNLKLNSGVGHTKGPVEREFVKYYAISSLSSKCSAFPASRGPGQSYASISHILLNVHNAKYLDPFH